MMIPLFLIAAVVSSHIRKVGEELQGIVVIKVNRYYYNIDIQTRFAGPQFAARSSSGRNTGLVRGHGMTKASVPKKRSASRYR